jgi:hypothetical protein
MSLFASGPAAPARGSQGGASRQLQLQPGRRNSQASRHSSFSGSRRGGPSKPPETTTGPILFPRFCSAHPISGKLRLARSELPC